MGEVLKFMILHGSLRKKRKKIFAFFCKNNSILRPFLVKFQFERPVLSCAKRAQNKHKKNWRAQAKLLDALSNDIMQRWSPLRRPWPRRRPRGHTFCSPWPRKSSPWPWPRSLISSKIALSSVRGQQYFLYC